MKVNTGDQKKSKDKVKEISPIPNSILDLKELDELTPQEIDALTVDELDYLRKKYQIKRPRPTIIGKEPYEPFLAEIKGDTWMSVGDKVKED